MRRFFVTPEAVQNDTVVFDAELARHMGKVLRLTSGEQVTVSTGDGTAYLVTLDEFGKDYVTGRIIEKMDNLQETAMEVVLYQGMPKGDKLELIIQKCTELGVSQVIPVETSRSVVHLDGNKAGKAEEAAQQTLFEIAENKFLLQYPKSIVAIEQEHHGAHRQSNGGNGHRTQTKIEHRKVHQRAAHGFHHGNTLQKYIPLVGRNNVGKYGSGEGQRQRQGGDHQ